MRKLAEVLEDWEAVIGLEVHTELTSLDTKMFCNCRLSHDDAPNTNVCPVCLGMPGALPVPNKAAIESIVLAGLATNCDIEFGFNESERKSRPTSDTACSASGWLNSKSIN